MQKYSSEYYNISLSRNPEAEIIGKKGGGTTTYEIIIYSNSKIFDFNKISEDSLKNLSLFLNKKLQEGITSKALYDSVTVNITSSYDDNTGYNRSTFYKKYSFPFVQK